jgi:hypothetical protein
VPVLTCPKCATKLKVPDGVSGNTRCPKCGTVFPVAKPAFEVVDDEPAPRPGPKSSAISKPAPGPKSSSIQRPAPAPKSDFEVVEDEPKKPVVADEDDDDDRPRKKRRYDDDDDEDRPKARKKRRYEDDDDGDEDDRPRKKKKQKRYFEENDYGDDWRPRGGTGGEFGKGKTGALLIGISFWLNIAAYGLLALYALIVWVLATGSSSSSSSSSSRGAGSGDGEFLDLIVVLPGLIGLGAWLVGIVGSSIAIGGPRKARGMAITATVFAGIHLILVGVTFSNLLDGIGLLRGAPGLGKISWVAVASTLPALDAFLPMLFYNSKAIGGDYIIAVLAGACEIARLIFALFALKALAAAARDYEVSEKSGYGVMIVSAAIGSIVLLWLVMAIILEEGKFKSLSTVVNLGLGTVFFMYLGYAVMMLSPAIAAMATRDACGRRT